jgi:hypothetical protein
MSGCQLTHEWGRVLDWYNPSIQTFGLPGTTSERLGFPENIFMN